MQRRGEGDQLGFADAIISARANSNTKLSAITERIDWRPVAAVVDEIRPGKRGRPPYAPLTMVKVLLLQTWYGLSDEALRDALGDRLSFRRFCGFSLEEEMPDSTTLCRFRTALGSKGAEAVFAEINRQLDDRGLMLKQGTLIDASLIKADVVQTGSSANQSKSGEALDPDAAWLKHKSSMIGYKVHVAADAGTLLVRAAKLTPANLHDSTRATDLVMGDEEYVMADKAYDTRAVRSHLIEQGIVDHVLHAARHNKPLTRKQEFANSWIAPLRRRIEKVFGTWKRSWGYRRTRYRSMERNRIQLAMIVTAWNLLRATKLRPVL